MTSRCVPGRHLLCKALLACLGGMTGAGAFAAESTVNLVAHYAISMTHVRIGELNWTLNFSDTSYFASASGKASGVLSVLVKGEGSFTTHGAVTGGQLTPKTTQSDISDDDGTYEIQMGFENGAVKYMQDRGDAPPSNRIPVSHKYLREVTDPLSAMLIPADSVSTQATCDKTLKIYDGRRRYDLALSFKRVEKIKVARGYAGTALVCGIVLHPIAGYKADSLLVRYLADKDDMEIWFAQIEGVPFMVPVRALMPTLVGTMNIDADEFAEQKTVPMAPVKPVDVTPLAPPKP